MTSGDTGCSYVSLIPKNHKNRLEFLTYLSMLMNLFSFVSGTFMAFVLLGYSDQASYECLGVALEVRSQ